MAIFSQKMAQKLPKLAENSGFDPKITKTGLKIDFTPEFYRQFTFFRPYEVCRVR